MHKRSFGKIFGVTFAYKIECSAFQPGVEDYLGLDWLGSNHIRIAPIPKKRSQSGSTHIISIASNRVEVSTTPIKIVLSEKTGKIRFLNASNFSSDT